MSRGARLSITGLYEYNSDLFSGLTVPDGMDRDTVIRTILMECSEFSLIYPSYTFMKMAIANWSKVEAGIWEKMYKTESMEYNPLWNVDATIEEDMTGTGVGSTKGYNERSWLDNAKSVNNDRRVTKRYGNIGVTSSQQLIEAERNVAGFSTVYYIVESFKKRFCVMIY